MTGASFHRGESKQDYGTDPRLVRAVVQRFGKMDFDLAATRENSQCGEDYFGPGSAENEDALSLSWDALKGNLWLNPPYADIATWAKKCASYRGMGKIFFLVPASVGANWFTDHVQPHAHTFILNGRLTFVGETNAFPKDCMLCVYMPAWTVAGELVRGTIEVWRWKK